MQIRQYGNGLSAGGAVLFCCLLAVKWQRRLTPGGICSKEFQDIWVFFNKEL